MNSISLTYRRACRELDLPNAEKTMLSKLLREMSTNADQRKITFQIKENFITLWFISVGRYPEFAKSTYCSIIESWVARQLPFELSEEDKSFLWI